MNAESKELWLAANQSYLSALLARIHACLEIGDTSSADEPLLHGQESCHEGMTGVPTIEQIVRAFGLSSFERDVLLLVAGAELDTQIATACGRLQGLGMPAAPTFSLALARLPDAHWSAIHPDSPLRSARLIRLDKGDLLTTSPLKIEERVLHFLTGIDHIDAQLAQSLVRVMLDDSLGSSHRALAQRIAERLHASHALPRSMVYLHGRNVSTMMGVAANAAMQAGIALYRIRARDLPQDAAERNEFAALWRRDAALSQAGLFVDASDIPEGAAKALGGLLEALRGVLFVVAREPLGSDLPPGVRFEVPLPSKEEQAALCRTLLGRAIDDEDVHRVTEQFPLHLQDIAGLAPAIAQHADGESSPAHALWQACRQARAASMEGLAQRIEARAGWDDLVLPSAPLALLHDIARHLRWRSKVYGVWGFAAKESRGLGISALFAGVSGTGKTMAAEVLANELALDLYRIDLASVVSKYIGETEKNLRRLFDAAEESGAVLLFDEADALFGKRSEVKDSHDRYANIEVSYLLQRMESYRGLAILTTNIKQNIDEAFLRRIRFVVDFPFPGMAERTEIWRRAFPAATPTDALDPARLARLSVAGGNIRNIAINTAFIAADLGVAVNMKHVMEAARAEYVKLGRSLGGAEMGESS